MQGNTDAGKICQFLFVLHQQLKRQMDTAAADATGDMDMCVDVQRDIIASAYGETIPCQRFIFGF